MAKLVAIGDKVADRINYMSISLDYSIIQRCKVPFLLVNLQVNQFITFPKLAWYNHKEYLLFSRIDQYYTAGAYRSIFFYFVYVSIDKIVYIFLMI